MITRFLLAFWLLLQVSVAGPGNQLLLSYKAPAAGGGTPTLANVWKNVGNGGSSLAVTVAPTAGSCLAVAVAEFDSTTDNTAMADNIGSTTGWTKIARAVNGSVSLVFWYKANIGSGVTTVTLTRSTGASYYNAHVFEITGANTSTPFTTGENSSATGASSSANTGTVTTATANSVLIALTTTDGGGNPESFTLNAAGTSGGTWAHFNTAAKEDNGSLNLVSSAPSLAVTTTAARIHYWTFSGSRTWVAGMIAIH